MKLAGGKLACDATDPREGRGDGVPCARRVTVEVTRTLRGVEGVYTMHYCARHAKRARGMPDYVVSSRVREVNP